MKLLSKIFTATLLLTLFVACKETKTDSNSSSATTETIKKVEAVETELEKVTESLEKEAEDLEKSLDALDDI